MRYYPNRFSLFNDDFFNSFFPETTHKAMACDIKEGEENYELAMNLPGFKKENIQMSLEDGYLTVQASSNREEQNHDDKGRWIRQERYSGTYQRSFFVGKNVSEQEIHASYEDGVLNITVPKVTQKAIEAKKMIPIE